MERMKMRKQQSSELSPPGQGWFSSMKQRAFAWLRVGVYLFCVQAVVGWGLWRMGSARAAEALDQWGRALVDQLGEHFVGDVQPLRINGQQMFFSSVEIEQPLKEVLDVLEQHCQDQSPPSFRQLGHLPPQVGATVVPEGLRDISRWGIARVDTADGLAGHVACFSQGQREEDSFEKLVERITQFSVSGDLSALGEARYFVARKLSDTKTQALSIWTEGPFYLTAMFPETGDAPGEDSVLIPRPPASTRLFSAGPADRPYALRIYESERSPEEIHDFYERELSRLGFEERLASPDDVLRDEFRAYTRGAVGVYVTLGEPEEGVTPVTVVETGSLGFAEANVGGPER